MTDEERRKFGEWCDATKAAIDDLIRRDRLKRERAAPAPQVLACFDGSGFTPDEVALCLGYLSEVYRDLGGAGLALRQLHERGH